MDQNGSQNSSWYAPYVPLYKTPIVVLPGPGMINPPKELIDLFRSILTSVSRDWCVLCAEHDVAYAQLKNYPGKIAFLMDDGIIIGADHIHISFSDPELFDRIREYSDRS